MMTSVDKSVPLEIFDSLDLYACSHKIFVV